MDYRAAQTRITEKTVKLHSIAILVVCTLFGALNFMRSNVGIGTFILGFGIVITLLSRFLANRAPIGARGILLTQATVIVIAVASASNGELHAMFALLVGNIAIGSIYYSPRNIRLAWILSDIVLILGLFFREIMYSGASTDLVAKGILGVNVGAVMISLLVKECIKSINAADEKTRQVDELLTQVRAQMEESEALGARQAQVMDEVSNVAGHLDVSSVSMRDIAQHLTSVSSVQAETISGIQSSIDNFAQSTRECFSVAENSQMASESAEIAHSLAEEVRRMNAIVAR